MFMCDLNALQNKRFTKENTLLFAFKLFAKCSDDRERFLRSSETDLKIPLLKTISGQKAFSYRGPKLWNSLERATKLAPSLKTFKEQL